MEKPGEKKGSKIWSTGKDHQALRVSQPWDSSAPGGGRGATSGGDGGSGGAKDSRHLKNCKVLTGGSEAGELGPFSSPRQGGPLETAVCSLGLEGGCGMLG